MLILAMNPRVPGHALGSEGRAYVAGRPSMDREGIAICQCGTFSPVLPNTARRQQWHREHKKGVLSGRARILGVIPRAPQ